MRLLVNSQALRCLFHTAQAVILASFLGAFFAVLTSMDVGVSSAKGDESASPQCTSRKSWIILPFAFLTGGLMNIEGFASTAMLLL